MAYRSFFAKIVVLYNFNENLLNLMIVQNKQCEHLTQVTRDLHDYKQLT